MSTDVVECDNALSISRALLYPNLLSWRPRRVQEKARYWLTCVAHRRLITRGLSSARQRNEHVIPLSRGDHYEEMGAFAQAPVWPGRPTCMTPMSRHYTQTDARGIAFGDIDTSNLWKRFRVLERTLNMSTMEIPLCPCAALSGFLYVPRSL